MTWYLNQLLDRLWCFQLAVRALWRSDLRDSMIVATAMLETFQDVELPIAVQLTVGHNEGRSGKRWVVGTAFACDDAGTRLSEDEYLARCARPTPPEGT